MAKAIYADDVNEIIDGPGDEITQTAEATAFLRGKVEQNPDQIRQQIQNELAHLKNVIELEEGMEERD